MSESIKKRTLGKSGLEITEISLGLWPIGGEGWGPVEDAESLRVIDRALELGVNFYDTADVYGFGHSEKILGKAMNGRRDKFIVATKIGWIGFDHENQSTAYTTVDKVVEVVELALKHLQTDYVDLIQSHINFRDKTMETMIEGFQKLQQDGKVRAYGVSTSNFEYLQQFNADGNCASLQIDHSILNRTSEAEIFPYCIENNIGVLVRGPLAMGILTGKLTPDWEFPDGDFRQAWQKDPERHKIFLEDLEKVEKLRPLTNGKTMGQLALQFSTAHPAVTASIPGAKTVQQLEQNIAAAHLPALTAEEWQIIDSISLSGGGRKIWPA